VKIDPYLNFDGRCEEAIEFYRKALGAQVLMLIRFKESPEPPPPGMSSPGIEEKVMHAALKIGETTVMASDGRCTGKSQFSGVTLSLSVKDTQEAQRVFAALSEGGKIHMPLSKTFYSPSFGMLADRFGVMWMVIAPQ
jgi:PhnB protein